MRAAAVSAAQRGELGVQIRAEVPAPQRLRFTPNEDVRTIVVNDLTVAWPQPPTMCLEKLKTVKADVADAWWDETFRGGEKNGLDRLSMFIMQDLVRYKDTRNGLRLDS